MAKCPKGQIRPGYRFLTCHAPSRISSAYATVFHCCTSTTPDQVPRFPALSGASAFGRIFARSGGLCEAVAQAMAEQNISFDLSPVVCDGIEACRTALLKKSKNLLDGNFIEGMACIGGCIGGAGCLTHGEKNKAEVDKYGKEATEKTITDAVAHSKAE